VQCDELACLRTNVHIVWSALLIPASSLEDYRGFSHSLQINSGTVS